MRRGASIVAAVVRCPRGPVAPGMMDAWFGRNEVVCVACGPPLAAAALAGVDRRCGAGRRDGAGGRVCAAAMARRARTGRGVVRGVRLVSAVALSARLAAAAGCGAAARVVAGLAD